jgi:predicted nucleic acid-binding protein
MLLVDTSVWIDFFQCPESETANTLATLIKGHNQVVLCGFVLQEILQGIKERKSYDLVREHLLTFPYIDTNRETWLLAASMYRDLRAQGITLPPVDVAIGALAVQHSLLLFTRDEHFRKIAGNSGLKLYG